MLTVEVESCELVAYQRGSRLMRKKSASLDVRSAHRTSVAREGEKQQNFATQRDIQRWEVPNSVAGR